MQIDLFQAVFSDFTVLDQKNHRYQRRNMLYNVLNYNFAAPVNNYKAWRLEKLEPIHVENYTDRR